MGHRLLPGSNPSRQRLVTIKAGSERYSPDSIDSVKVDVVTQYRERMLDGKRRNPNIVRWNRIAFRLQLQSDIGVCICRGGSYRCDLNSWYMCADPRFIPGTMTRLPDPEHIFPENNTRQDYSQS